MTHAIALINGRLIDPVRQTEEVTNLLLDDTGLLVGLGYLPDDETPETTVIDLQGRHIIPNVTDTNIILNNVWQTQDTLEHLGEGAARSGVSHIIISACDAPLDTPEKIAFFKEQSQQVKVHAYPFGALSKDGDGESLAELRLMSEAGAIGFYEGNSLNHSGLMRHALQYSSNLSRPIVITPFDAELSQNGVMTEGATSTQLGLRGYPAACEAVRLSRDIQLVERFGGTLHVSPITTKASLDLVRSAKARGVSITCGTAPHYLWFSDEDIMGYDTNKKVMPPLPSKSDQLALIAGIKDGTIDCIASHHTPLGIDEKRTDFVSATPGMSGLDTFIPAVLTRLIRDDQFAIKDIAQLITSKPNQIFNLQSKGVVLNSRPNLTVVDLKTPVTVSPDILHSWGKNSGYFGKTLVGFPVLTLSDGKIVWQSSTLD